MQFEFKINDGWFLTSLSGDIDFVGILEALAEFEQLEKKFPPYFNRVTDLTGATSIDLDYNEVSGVAKKRMAAYLPDEVKSAFVVSNDEQHGFARMFFSLNNHPKIELKLFKNLAEAIDWIAPIKNDRLDEPVGLNE